MTTLFKKRLILLKLRKEGLILLRMSKTSNKFQLFSNTHGSTLRPTNVYALNIKLQGFGEISSPLENDNKDKIDEG